MPRDYRETIRALRAKAADNAVTDHEREALLAKAKEIEEAHGIKPDLGGTFSFRIHIPTDDETEEQARRFWDEKNREAYNRMYHDDYNGFRDEEMPPNSPGGTGRYGWSPDKGKYRRQWNPHHPDEQDLISPEFRYDWEE